MLNLKSMSVKTKIVTTMTVKGMIVLVMMSKKVIQNAPLALLLEMVTKLLNLLRLIEHLHFSESNQHHGTVSLCLNSVLN